jgi:hypothetical protein
MNQAVAVGIALFVLFGLTGMLYRPRVPQSIKYQAMVVPLSNIMDVGFIGIAASFAAFAAVSSAIRIALVGQDRAPSQLLIDRQSAGHAIDNALPHSTRWLAGQHTGV